MLAKAMTHPLRREILRHMRETGTPIAAVEVGTALMAGRKEDTGLASYHVGKLEEYGLIEFHHDERVRGCTKTYYSLTEAAGRQPAAVDSLLDGIAQLIEKHKGNPKRALGAISDVIKTNRAVVEVI
jgi:DNA-binding transcriptional ArsR family regulator